MLDQFDSPRIRSETECVFVYNLVFMTDMVEINLDTAPYLYPTVSLILLTHIVPPSNAKQRTRQR